MISIRTFFSFVSLSPLLVIAWHYSKKDSSGHKLFGTMDVSNDLDVFDSFQHATFLVARQYCVRVPVFLIPVIF